MGAATVFGLAFLVALCNAGVVRNSTTCTPEFYQACMQPIFDLVRSKGIPIEAIANGIQNYTYTVEDLKAMCSIYPRVFECADEAAKRDSCVPEVAKIVEFLKSTVNLQCGPQERNVVRNSTTCTPGDFQACMQPIFDLVRSKGIPNEFIANGIENYTYTAEELKAMCSIYPGVIECVGELANRDSCVPEVAKTVEFLKSIANSQCGPQDRNLYTVLLENQACVRKARVAAEVRCKQEITRLRMLIDQSMKGSAKQSSVCRTKNRYINCHVIVATEQCGEAFGNFVRNAMADWLSKVPPGISCSSPNSST